MMVLYESADRGSTRMSWLESRHGFSFAGWHDPARTGFRALRPARRGLAPAHFDLAPGRGAWVPAVRGDLVVNGTHLAAGDALALEAETAVVVAGEPEGDALLFDLGPAHTSQEAAWDD